MLGMEKLLQMLKDVEINNQGVYLRKLKVSKEGVGCFIPALNADMFMNRVGIVKQLLEQEINIAFVVLFDGVAGLAESLKVDVPVVAMSQLKVLSSKPEKIIMIHSEATWPDAFYQYFLRLGITPFVLWDSSVLEKNKKYYWSNILKIYNAYMSFDDDLSRASFLGALKARLTGQPYDRVYALEGQYMLDGFRPYKGSIAIDGGAFDGETGKDFSELGANVYSFELDKNNYLKVAEKGKKYDFHAVNMGLWSCKKQERYIHAGTGSTVTKAGSDVAYLIDIDTFVKENDIPRIDYIKLDVEGAELDVLKGAVMSIGKWKPILAISAYHREEDLWVLHDFIKSVRSDYNFAFRHYKIDSRDYYLTDSIRKLFVDYDMSLMVPTQWESVLYAK